MEGRGRSSGGRGGRGYWRGGSRGSRGRGMHPPDSKYRKGYSDEAEEQVKEMFAKRFNFEDEFEQWRLPEPLQLYRDGVFQLPKFVSLRDKLNEVKSRLNHKDISSWHRHTQFTNRAAFIIPSLRSKSMLLHERHCLYDLISLLDTLMKLQYRINAVHSYSQCILIIASHRGGTIVLLQIIKHRGAHQRVDVTQRHSLKTSRLKFQTCLQQWKDQLIEVDYRTLLYLSVAQLVQIFSTKSVQTQKVKIFIVICDKMWLHTSRQSIISGWSTARKSTFRAGLLTDAAHKRVT